MKPESKTAEPQIHALAFGLFLGLCIWKFGNPVILDHQIGTPATAQDLWTDAWPTHWARWILAPLAAWGAWLVWRRESNRGPETTLARSLARWPSKWLWLLPLAWLGWQVVSFTQTQYPDLAAPTVWQFCGCAAAYFLGALVFARGRLTRWLLAGALAGFAYCLVQAVDQRLFEYPQNARMLTEGERCGWTNFSPATVTEMKHSGVIITTNGLDIANPAILTRVTRGRVSGTLIYPNALAEMILLLWPVSLVLAFGAAKNLRPLVRRAAITMTVLLGGAAFFWSGSKLGWLIALGLAGLILLRRPWPQQLKWAAVTAVLVVGLGVFAVRFHHYFAAGATSVTARLDYWRAAVETTGAHPWVGTGPGTFQRPYALIKSPDSEMARLAHNDYLEQFSDSGILGGVTYCAWIILALVAAGKKLWRTDDHFSFALFVGLLGWFAQSLGEFGLFVPALAWIAFTLLGALIGPAGAFPGGRKGPK